MASLSKQLDRSDAESELTKLLRHGYGSLTIKIHGHRIASLDSTTRHTRTSYSDDERDEE